LENCIDSDRMVLADLIYGAAKPAGWAPIEQPSDKERRFLTRLGIDRVEADVLDLIGASVAT